MTPETDFQRIVYPQWNSETADDGAVPETQRPIFYVLPREVAFMQRPRLLGRVAGSQ